MPVTDVLEALVERRVRAYVAREIDRLEIGALEAVERDLHPRRDTVVVLKIRAGHEVHLRYVDMDPGPGRPFPCFSEEDPCPLH